MIYVDKIPLRGNAIPGGPRGPQFRMTGSDENELHSLAITLGLPNTRYNDGQYVITASEREQLLRQRDYRVSLVKAGEFTRRKEIMLGIPSYREATEE